MDSVLDRVHGIAIVNVVVRPMQRPRLTLLRFEPRVQRQEPVLSQPTTELADFLVLEAHDLRDVVVPDGRMREDNVEQDAVLWFIEATGNSLEQELDIRQAIFLWLGIVRCYYHLESGLYYSTVYRQRRPICVEGAVIYCILDGESDLCSRSRLL